MLKKEFATAWSQKDAGDAAKEVSLRIKSIFPDKRIAFLLVLFTPHYNPSAILRIVNLTLAPKKIAGIQAPFLIFEDKIIGKGVVACCLNKETMDIKELFVQKKGIKEVESCLNAYLRNIKRKEFSFFSFTSPEISPLRYLDSVRLSLGRVFDFFGAGFIKKYSLYSPQIANTSVQNGVILLALKGIATTSFKLEGCLPLGKPFKITKIIRSKNVIMEINDSPAINVYREYLEEKFDVFTKHRLFVFYPLGIKDGTAVNLVSIVDYLEDGSLVYLGEVKEGDTGYIMLFDQKLIIDNIKKNLKAPDNKTGGVAFAINSLTRKKILQEKSEEELRLIKSTLGDDFRLIGLYSDYLFSSNKQKRDIEIENNNLLLTLLQ